ncbi:ParA family protein [Natronoglomus mannanivorans]|uniref:ParA family protein n=1 Tax=Natronoglomus mannanivorans TaxID=2979990 RepID=A0AAP3E452_9EURY|nr:ParA family protein [Halobacteria archaeon AArc-xg1-1]
MPQTNRLTLYNAKGGTGKTTVGINVAGALAQRGKSVCFVDLDPQGNATEGLGFVEIYDLEDPNLLDHLLEADRDPSELVLEHEEFDVIPSNVEMLNAEYELSIDDYEGYPAVEYLDDLLDDLDGQWDYILIDAPPFFGEITDNALYASKNVLIPALTESTSERAVELLLDQIVRLEREEDIFVDEIAAVANRVETNNEAERMKEWMESAFPDIPVFNVRKRVALQRAHSEGVSIFKHEESSDMEAVFLEIADAVIEHFGDTQ